MKVFHGSTEIVRHPLIHVGRNNLDFGKGFYVTDLREQAISWASRPYNQGLSQWLNIYEFDMKAAIRCGYKHLHFTAYDYRWLEFVVGNRRGEKLWKGFDIIEGGIANDRVFNTIELYAAGLTPQEDALAKLRFEKPNNQLCLLNQEMVDQYLHFIDAEEVTVSATKGIQL